MRQQTRLLPSMFLMCLSSVMAFAQAAGPAPGSPEAVIQSFYKWYVHSLNQNSDPFEKQRPTLRKYVTQRLIAEIDKAIKGPDGLDGDYFLDAQDFDKDWEKNITVSSVLTTKTAATAQVTLNGAEMTRKLKVTLKQEAGVWMIDKVAGLDN
jgi:Protein of unknown function (DUF3828)